MLSGTMPGLVRPVRGRVLLTGPCRAWSVLVLRAKEKRIPGDALVWWVLAVGLGACVPLGADWRLPFWQLPALGRECGRVQGVETVALPVAVPIGRYRPIGGDEGVVFNQYAVPSVPRSTVIRLKVIPLKK